MVPSLLTEILHKRTLEAGPVASAVLNSQHAHETTHSAQSSLGFVERCGHGNRFVLVSILVLSEMTSSPNRRSRSGVDVVHVFIEEVVSPRKPGADCGPRSIAAGRSVVILKLVVIRIIFARQLYRVIIP